MTRARVLFVSLVVSLVIAVTVLAQNRAANLPPAGSTGWFAWKVPVRGHSICCNRCSLDGNRGFSINDDDDLDITSEILLAVRVENGKIRKVRLFDGACTLDPKVQILANVSTEDSVAYLLAQIPNADREGELMAAIAMHDHPRVVPALLEFARHDPDRETRRHAIFWLGQKAGDKVAGELRRFVDEDPDDDVKQHAVFAISQLPRERSVPLLIDLVKTHKNRMVRERALFWLAQTGDPRAIDLIESILMP